MHPAATGAVLSQRWRVVHQIILLMKMKVISDVVTRNSLDLQLFAYDRDWNLITRGRRDHRVGAARVNKGMNGFILRVYENGMSSHDHPGDLIGR